MKAYMRLPEGYRFQERIDLVKNRKQLITVNVLSIALAALTVAAGFLFRPQNASFGWLQWIFAFAGIALYIVGHEAVHGVLMWLISHEKPRLGFKLMYAYAGSSAYFDKPAYLLIAIAPLAFWTPVLCALAVLVPPGWFWVVWAVQIGNISGAAGDLYVFFRMLQKPQNTLVQDTGTAMTVYLPAA